MLYLLNSSIIPANFVGSVHVEEVSTEKAKEYLSIMEFESAVGHKPTADVMTALLGVDVKTARKTLAPVAGDAFLVMQLEGRLEEGKILSETELKALKFKWKVLKFAEDARPRVPEAPAGFDAAAAVAKL